MNNKVSVIIPVYNTKDYLDKCVHSILKQTYQNLEILLVDDGSSDGSAVLCDKLALEDSRIKVIHKQNEGQASARNLGIHAASGEYIMFVDSDDWLDIDAIETLVDHANRNKVDVIHFNYVREFLNKSVFKKNTFLEERVYDGDECNDIRRLILGLSGETLAYLENMRFLAPCTLKMYRADIIQNFDVTFVSLREIGAFEDGLFNFCVFSRVKRFEFLNRAYYHYRKTNKNATTVKYRPDYINRQLKLFSILASIIHKEEAWDLYKDAFQSHILYATMEIAFNALNREGSTKERYKEIKSVLNHPFFVKVYKDSDLSYLKLKWKIYFFFIKHSMTLPVYLMTTIIMRLKSKGTA